VRRLGSTAAESPIGSCLLHTGRIRRRAGLLPAIVALLALVPACAREPVPPPATGETLRVAAPSSLRGLLERAGAAFARTSGVRVECTFDAPSALAATIRAGEPFDVFLSDEAALDRVADRVLPGTRRVILSNQLALVGRAGWVPAPTAPGLLAYETAFAAARLVIPGPAVPAGRDWREWMAAWGVQAALEPRCLVSDSARAALELVQAGTADAAFVYASDLDAEAGAGRVVLLASVPVGEGPPIAYLAAALREPFGRPAGSEPPGLAARAMADEGRGAPASPAAGVVSVGVSVDVGAVEASKDCAGECACTPAATAFVEWLCGEEFRTLAREAGFATPR